MKRINISLSSLQDFEVIASTGRSQAATMVVAPRDSVGSRDNRHESSDQWIYVLSGRGHAIVDDEEVSLEPGTLLLIEAGEHHEITNDGDEPLRTFDVYAPPAY